MSNAFDGRGQAIRCLHGSIIASLAHFTGLRVVNSVNQTIELIAHVLSGNAGGRTLEMLGTCYMSIQNTRYIYWTRRAVAMALSNTAHTIADTPRVRGVLCES